MTESIPFNIFNTWTFSSILCSSAYKPRLLSHSIFYGCHSTWLQHYISFLICQKQIISISLKFTKYEKVRCKIGCFTAGNRFFHFISKHMNSMLYMTFISSHVIWFLHDPNVAFFLLDNPQNSKEHHTGFPTNQSKKNRKSLSSRTINHDKPKIVTLP